LLAQSAQLPEAMMKALAIALLTAFSLPYAAALAQDHIYIVPEIHYVRGTGILTVADERDRYEKRRNRLGTGLILINPIPSIDPMPHKKR
jgi:hypothetical protein